MHWQYNAQCFTRTAVYAKVTEKPLTQLTNVLTITKSLLSSSISFDAANLGLNASHKINHIQYFKDTHINLLQCCTHGEWNKQLSL